MYLHHVKIPTEFEVSGTAKVSMDPASDGKAIADTSGAAEEAGPKKMTKSQMEKYIEKLKAALEAAGAAVPEPDP